MLRLVMAIVLSLMGYAGGELSQLPAAANSPLPTAVGAGMRADHEGLLRAFITAINDARVDEAIAMLDPRLVAGDARAAWRSQFQAIVAIAVIDIQPAEDQAVPCYEYRVRLHAEMSPDSASAPIPFYGWDSDPNIRWISLCPGENRPWQISSIGTGP